MALRDKRKAWRRALNDYLRELETLIEDEEEEEPPPEFRPMSQFMGQVLRLDDMREFVNEGWTGGFQTFTNQSGSLQTWLSDCAQAGRGARISVSRNWFSDTQLNQMGLAGVSAIKAHEDRIYGVEVEISGIQQEAFYVALRDALGDQAYLLDAYQNTPDGRPYHGDDYWLGGYSRIWYQPVDPTPGVGQQKKWLMDSAGTYPAYVMQLHKPVRTPDNRPKRGVRTGNFWALCRGERPQGAWGQGTSGASGTVQSGIIRPMRGQMHYRLLCAHMMGINTITWYTNGSVSHPRMNMPSYDPHQFRDLVHVIEAYETQEMIDTFSSSYINRVPFVVTLP